MGGIVVMLCHDISDFCLNFAKVVRDLRICTWGLVIDMLYLSIVFSFGYFRVFVAFNSWIFYGYDVVGFAPMIFGGKELQGKDIFEKYLGITMLPHLLLLLGVMNIYWVWKAIELGIQKLKGEGYTSEWEGEEKNKASKKEN